MKVSRALRCLCVAVILNLILPGVMAAQNLPTRGAFNAPFDFYVSGEKFPAGPYTLDGIAPAFVMLRSKDGKFEHKLYLLQTAVPVNNPPLKIIFALRDGKYYLAEVWSWYGKSQLNSFTPNASDQTKGVPLRAAE